MTGFIQANLITLLFGAITIEALLELIGGFLPRKYSVAGARSLGVFIGIIIAFLILEPISAHSIVSAIIAGVVMSRGSECIHALINCIISLPKVIAGITNKQAIIAVQPPELKADIR